MPLGIVVSTPDSPSTNEFSFLLRSRDVRAGEFVKALRGDGSAVVGLVTGLQASNRYFERPESVSAYEDVNAAFPTSEWDIVTAACIVLGDFDGSRVSKTGFPPLPGAKVEAASPEEVKKILGLDDKGYHLGELMAHRAPATVNPSRLLQKHVALLGISGSGKSHLAASILEEILSQSKPLLGAVAFDVHGDYLGFGQGEFKDKTAVIDARKIRVSARHLSPQTLRELSPDLSAAASFELRPIWESLKEKGEAFDLGDVRHAVEESEMSETVRAPLLKRLAELDALKIIGKADYPLLSKVMGIGKLAVVDLSEITSQHKKQALLALLGRKLFMLRRKNKVPPFLLLIEEAHNFAREGAPREAAVSRSLIELVAREGRKFGACLCLVSQRPVQLSTTALSQCNSFAVLRITNPYDLQRIGESAEGIDANVQRQLTSLKVGECILFGEAVNYPAFIRVRKRRSAEGGKGKPLPELAAEYEAETRLRREAQAGAAGAFL